MIPHNLTMIPFRRTVRSVSFAHHRWINPTVLFVISRNSDESLSVVLNRTFLSDARPRTLGSPSVLIPGPCPTELFFSSFWGAPPYDLLSNIPDHQIVAYTSAISLQTYPNYRAKADFVSPIKKTCGIFLWIPMTHDGPMAELQGGPCPPRQLTASR